MTDNELNQKEKIQLTAEELKAMGAEISDVVSSLEVSNIAIDCLLSLHKKDLDRFAFLSMKFFSEIYPQIVKFCKKLDDVSFFLLECDNKKELEGEKE